MRIMNTAKRLPAVFACLSIIVFIMATGCDRLKNQSAPARKPAAVSQAAKDSVFALNKLKSKIHPNISYDDYLHLLEEARFPVMRFLESQDANKFPEAVRLVRSIFSDYEFAGEIWNRQQDKHFLSPYPEVNGAIPLTDFCAQDIIKRLPGINKPISGELQKRWKDNAQVREKLSQGIAAPTDQIRPLAPENNDGAIFERKEYRGAVKIGAIFYNPKNAKREMMQFLDLEIVYRILWLRAGETLERANALFS